MIKNKKKNNSSNSIQNIKPIEANYSSLNCIEPCFADLNHLNKIMRENLCLFSI